MTTLTISPDMSPAERLVRLLVIQVWEHYRMVQDGIFSLEQLGYGTLENGQIPAFWVDVFTHIHRVAVEAKSQKS